MGADHDGGRAAGAKGAATEETRKGLRLRILPGTGCHRAGPPSKSGARAGGGRSDDFTQSNCGGTEAELATSATTCLHPQPPSRAYICVRNPSFSERSAKFSPDGRFVAYVSDESGRNEVYVRPFPGGDGKWQVSGNGGAQPRWSKNGKELFYVERDTLMAVAALTTPRFTSGLATRLFQDANLLGIDDPRYDVSADGRRFVLTEPVAGTEAKPPSIHVVQNWYEEFRDRDQDYGMHP